jgi:pimeloyl-ACP methyl ester carboxylesterase
VGSLAWRSAVEVAIDGCDTRAIGGTRIGVRTPGVNCVVVFFDGGAGDCPAPLQDAHRVVRSSRPAGGIRAWLDSEGVERAHVIGHAAGGSDALRFALTYPARTWSLILSETGAGLRHAHATLLSLTVPVLVVAGGGGSACPPPTARRLAAHFSNGRVAEIVEAARSPYAETPEEWCEVVLQFLRSVTRLKAVTP